MQAQPRIPFTKYPSRWRRLEVNPWMAATIQRNHTMYSITDITAEALIKLLESPQQQLLDIELRQLQLSFQEYKLILLRRLMTRRIVKHALHPANHLAFLRILSVNVSLICSLPEMFKRPSYAARCWFCQSPKLGISPARTTIPGTIISLGLNQLLRLLLKAPFY